MWMAAKTKDSNTKKFEITSDTPFPISVKKKSLDSDLGEMVL